MLKSEESMMLLWKEAKPSSTNISLLWNHSKRKDNVRSVQKSTGDIHFLVRNKGRLKNQGCKWGHRVKTILREDFTHHRKNEASTFSNNSMSLSMTRVDPVEIHKERSQDRKKTSVKVMIRAFWTIWRKTLRILNITNLSLVRIKTTLQQIWQLLRKTDWENEPGYIHLLKSLKKNFLISHRMNDNKNVN